jgi:hypothetical protein
LKRRILLFVTGLLLVLTPAGLGPPNLAAQGGKLDVLGKFPASIFSGELDVATYTENTERVGLLGISRDKRVSYAFHANEWESLIELFRKAEPVQGASWQFVGSLKEVGTKDPTLLIVTAGAGIRFTMETADGSFAVVLSRNDYERFETSLRQVATYLGNGQAAR